ncbi:hypothetical protein BJ138DRAFT_362550 [Hygrophoropsis aurantiaca]|uniref:Uncharacterized protein n=1 Tax=Hygrophoropsis aurantiaca TaxID=72124 RepID=A0ACB8AM23_9AGAM|nr:hypothetical protein BJ138DRAFT_362550 [Hygrophoropsis aurantiaca]
MPGTTLPPFPDDIPTHPLLIIDFERIKAGDQEEIDTLWKAATTIGFWYLKNHGIEDQVDGMFEMGAETVALPLEEKMKYEQGEDGQSYGYKKAGAYATDATGQNLDTVEFVNISMDDALSYPNVVYRTYLSTVTARMESTITPFAQKSADVSHAFMAIFNEKLGLPEGTLARLHDPAEYSGSELRCIRSPPMPGKMSAERVALGSHTDFGSFTLLFNRLGGLQVLPEGHEQWLYVKPIPGHAVCNIGDALALYSGGILNSNIHRVVPPPGPQGEFERWSLAFFLRPGNSRILRALVEDSPIIAEAVKQRPGRNFEPGETANEWRARRVRNQRIKNRKGPETWAASRGTEYAPTVA